jgi:predicted alpha/beta hydrolase family esterase
MPARVLLLHGFEHHRPREHWLWWLAEELRSRAIPVQYPQLPNPDAPRVAEQTEVASSELDMLGDGERIVVTHSLGGILWQHLAAAGAHVDRVLMVAPPSRDRLVGPLGDFAVGGIDVPAALGASPVTLVARESDPYRSLPLADMAARWPVTVVELPGAGHLTVDDGHGPFPAALDWVLTGEWPR